MVMRAKGEAGTAVRPALFLPLLAVLRFTGHAGGSHKLTHVLDTRLRAQRAGQALLSVSHAFLLPVSGAFRTANWADFGAPQPQQLDGNDAVQLAVRFLGPRSIPHSQTIAAGVSQRWTRIPLIVRLSGGAPADGGHLFYCVRWPLIMRAW